MSIDARIAGVSVTTEAVWLNLEPREKGGCAGQSRMEIVNPPNPPTLLEALVGECIWGNAATIMLGDTKFADRIGYCAMKLVEKKAEANE